MLLWAGGPDWSGARAVLIWCRGAGGTDWEPGLPRTIVRRVAVARPLLRRAPPPAPRNERFKRRIVRRAARYEAPLGVGGEPPRPAYRGFRMQRVSCWYGARRTRKRRAYATPAAAGRCSLAALEEPGLPPVAALEEPDYGVAVAASANVSFSSPWDRRRRGRWWSFGDQRAAECRCSRLFAVFRKRGFAGRYARGIRGFELEAHGSQRVDRPYDIRRRGSLGATMLEIAGACDRSGRSALLKDVGELGHDGVAAQLGWSGMT